MSWLRKVLGYNNEPDLPPVVLPSPELTAARRRHRLLLNRANKEIAEADLAIKAAMAHADEMFEPERRRQPR